MRTEVKIGLVICVLVVGIVIVTNLFSDGEDEAANATPTDSQPARPARVATQPATTPATPATPALSTRPSTARPAPRPATTIGSPVQLSTAPDPVRPARAATPTTPATSAAPASRPTPIAARPTTPATPATTARPTSPLGAASVRHRPVDYSALRPAANNPVSLATPQTSRPTPSTASDPAATLPRLNGVGPAAQATEATPAANSAAAAPVSLGMRTYVVEAGDNGFYGIAKKVYGSVRYSYLISQANRDADSTRLRVGQTLKIPPLPQRARQVEAARAGSAQIHTVVSGDRAWDLAKRYLGDGKYIYLLERANPEADLDNLQIGQKLVIPSRPAESSAVAAGAANAGSHTIAAADTLSQISSRYYGTARLWPAIQQANPGLDANRLRVGQKIVIPSRQQAMKMLNITEAPAASTAAVSNGSTASGSGYTDPRPMFD